MTTSVFDLPTGHLPEAPDLRAEVRAFLAGQVASGAIEPSVDTWLGRFDPDFSRAVGAAGWLGMTWPRRYGGHERSALERFVVIEELLAGGAPVSAHWMADRQIGPSLLRFGTEEQRHRFLPDIAAGTCYFSIGLSEPDSGSDLASVRTRATAVAGGWRVSGSKVWTSGAHLAHFLVALVRTGEAGHAGLSQVIVDLSDPHVTIRPILTGSGEHHFNEVVFDDVYVPDAMVLGRVGDGWRQVTAELAHERSGPERFLSTVGLLVELTRLAEGSSDSLLLTGLGSAFARLWALRQLSVRVAIALDSGEAPDAAAALVKDAGTRFEQDTVEIVRRLAVDREPGGRLDRLLELAVERSPSFTLRGGTNEILRILVSRAAVA